MVNYALGGRITFACDDLALHFANLQSSDNLPSIEELRRLARTLHRRYSTQRAWDAAVAGGDAAADMGWATGTWTPPTSESSTSDQPPQPPPTVADPTDLGVTRGLGDGDDNASDAGSERSSESSVSTGSEESTSGFSGDRTLAQSILFMRDTMLLRDASQAVASGDVGRLWNDFRVS